MSQIESPHTLKIQELLKRVAEKRESKAGIFKPTLEQFDGEQDKYRAALELWRVGQDERLAQEVLDNAGATFTARENANRTLRRCKKRRREIEPIDDFALTDDGGVPDANPDTAEFDRPWAERFPYQESKKSKWLTPEQDRQSYKTLCAWMDEFQRIGKMSPEERKAYWDKQESEHFARVEQRRLEDSTIHAKFKSEASSRKSKRKFECSENN